jgi:dihydrolipoamide dehydrogenase
MKMSDRYDVAIIGAGTAGLSALNEVKRRTDNYVLINDGPYGTTCARVGCMPSKALIEIARSYHRRSLFDEFGIKGGNSLSVDIPAVLGRVRRLRDGFVRGTLKTTERLGDHNIPGKAQFVDADTLSVNGRIIRADKIIIATGSRPVVPDAWRALDNRLLTTDNLFEQADLPPTIAVIGLGPVGTEMAQALAHLGIKIEAFDLATHIAGLTDPLVNTKAVTCLGRDYTMHLGAPVEVDVNEGRVRVRAGDITVLVDKIMAALGRRPNIDDLGLDRLGVTLDKRGLPSIDPCSMQIGNLPIFIAGDSSNHAPLMHEAADEGHIAGLNVTAPNPVRYARRTPLAIVFSDPHIAMVGRRFSSISQDEAIIGESVFDQQGRAMAAGTNKGIIRVYGDKESGLLLGVEMCAPDGEHLAHLFALAIQKKMTVQDLLAMPFYHPVIEEGLRSALRDLARQLPTRISSDLGMCEEFGSNALD